MKSLLIFVISVILFFYLAGWIGRIALRYWITKKQKQFAEQMRNAAGQAYGGYGASGSANSSKKKKEGEVKIYPNRNSGRNVAPNVGDYVEFEEIKEDCAE